MQSPNRDERTVFSRLASIAVLALPDPKAPIPRQIRYIIGNDGCERIENMQLLPRIDSELDFLE